MRDYGEFRIERNENKFIEKNKSIMGKKKRRKKYQKYIYDREER